MVKQGEQVSKRYELVKKYTRLDPIFNKHKLYRIRALCDIPQYDVRAGDLGGWVEGEHNLSQDCSYEAWVGGNACVFDHAQVAGHALVCDNAAVYGSARVLTCACVCGGARVTGSATVKDNAVVSGSAKVSGNAWVRDNARVYGFAEVHSRASVSGVAHVHGGACLDSPVVVSQNADIRSQYDWLYISHVMSTYHDDIDAEAISAFRTAHGDIYVRYDYPDAVPLESLKARDNRVCQAMCKLIRVHMGADWWGSTAWADDLDAHAMKSVRDRHN